ncbi:MOSC domain-containing protein [Rhizobium paknamense]|nr:MOSC domain-containing protein [Rhizobium paknamense]
MQVSKLAIYPLKSARGIGLRTSPVTPEGLRGDRRMMLVDESGTFASQRSLPGLARLQAQLSEGQVTLTLNDGRSLTFHESKAAGRRAVTVWSSTVDAACAPDPVNRTLSDWLGQKLSLVFFDKASERVANPEWAGPNAPLAFADGYPVLITTTGSLAALNADMERRGEGQIGMERFRPNIVVDCEEAWAEDRWAALAINGIRFDLVKPCARCIIITQDQESGSRDGASPMPAMGRLRMSGDRRVPGPLFGWNAVPRGSGQISTGDRVELLEERPEGWPIKRRGGA